MAMNQAQFQARLWMAQFIRQYGSETKCYRALFGSRWPQWFLLRQIRRAAALEVCATRSRVLPLSRVTSLEDADQRDRVRRQPAAVHEWFLVMHLLTASPTLYVSTHDPTVSPGSRRPTNGRFGGHCARTMTMRMILLMKSRRPRRRVANIATLA